jgi:hypothetical protein
MFTVRLDDRVLISLRIPSQKSPQKQRTAAKQENISA